MNFKPVLGPGMSSKGRTRSSTFAESSKSSRLSKVIGCVFCNFQTATKGLRFCARCRRFLRRAMLEEYISDSSDQAASAGDRPSLLCKFSKYWQLAKCHATSFPGSSLFLFEREEGRGPWERV